MGKNKTRKKGERGGTRRDRESAGRDEMEHVVIISMDSIASAMKEERATSTSSVFERERTQREQETNAWP